MEAPHDWKRDLWRIAVVMLFGLTIRIWVVSHTEVTARDSIGFIRYALNLEQPPVGLTSLDVIRREPHPPGYVSMVLLVSWPVRAIQGGTTVEAMVLSCQIVSVLAAMLLVIPMYFLGRRLFDRQSSFIGCALFQVLPVCAQVTSDGLSDGLFLLTGMTTLWLGVRAVEEPSSRRFLVAGMGSGFAYLIRPEGLILATSIGFTILLLRLTSRIAWRPAFAQAATLSLGVLIVGGPYVLTIGKLTNKTTGNGLIDFIKGEENGPVWQARPVERTSLATDLPLAAFWNDGLNRGESKMLWAVKSLGTEMLKTFHYLTAGLALCGVWFCWPRRGEPGMRLLASLVCLHGLLLLVMAAKIGYVSERHTLLIVMLGCLFAGFAIGELVKRANAYFANPKAPPLQWGGKYGIPITVALLVAISLPGALKPLHANRAGHHAAGLWLAKNASPEEVIWDPFAWAEFYAGRSMYADPIRERNDYHIRNTYVILEPSNPNPHSKLPMIPKAQEIARGGTIVYHWPENGSVEKAKVVIYKSPPQPGIARE